MMPCAREHPPRGTRLPAGAMRSALALAVLLMLGAAAPLAAGATTPQRGANRHASHSSHRGRCADRAHRGGRRHRHCPARRHTGAKAPAPALALTAPAGPTVQPIAPIVIPPVAPTLPAAAISAPASEGAKPGEGGGEAGEGVEPPSIPHVQVSAIEYAFTLSRTSVPAGKVIFQFVNNGQDEHNLKIALSEGPLAGSFANTPAKGIGDLQLEIQPGQYTLFCSLPTHEQKGMKATLTVE
jgi:plastocyanin